MSQRLRPMVLDKIGKEMTVHALLAFKEDAKPVRAELPETDTGIVDGILFRDAVEAQLSVCKTKCDSSGVASPEIKFKETVAIPQAGPVLLLTMTNGPLQANSIKVAFGENGKLLKLEYGDNARFAAIAGAAATAAESISGTIDAVRRSDIEKSKIEKEQLELDRNVLKLRQETDQLNAKEPADTVSP